MRVKALLQPTRFVASMIGLLVLASPSAKAEYELRYAVVDLGVPDGYARSYAVDINASGQVLGRAHNSQTDYRSFLHSDGHFTILEPPNDGGPPRAHSFNDLGQIVGDYYWEGDFDSGLYEGTYAFLYDGGTFTNLGSFGREEIKAYGINNNGIIVGWGVTGSITAVGFSYDINVGKLETSGLFEFPMGINNLGSTVGAFDPMPGGFESFTYYMYLSSSSSGWHVLGPSEGYSQNLLSLNDLDQVVGKMMTPSGDYHAFLYSDGVMHDLGTLGGKTSEAYDINNLGQIVGAAALPGARFGVPFLYSHGVMMDLNSLLEPGSGWRINEAVAINDSGQIAASGSHPVIGNRALLLNPIQPTAIPEPSSLLMSGLAMLAAGGYGWRRRRVGRW